MNLNRDRISKQLTLKSLSICVFAASALLQFVLSAEARFRGEEFLFLNCSDMRWQKSPNGYFVSFGKLLAFRSNGTVASLNCSFYRDSPKGALMYGDIGGFKFEAGTWATQRPDPKQLRLELRLIDSDKIMKPVGQPEQQTGTTKTSIVKLTSANSLKEAQTIRADNGMLLTRIQRLKNQQDLDKLLDGLSH